MSVLEGFGARLESEIKSKYDGNMSAFLRACARIDRDAAPADGTTVKKYYDGSVPGLDKAIVMARALNLTIDQMLKPATQKGQRADEGPRMHPLVNETSFRFANGKSVQSSDIPNATIFRSYAFGIGKDKKMFVDLMVSGPDQRSGVEIGGELD